MMIKSLRRYTQSSKKSPLKQVPVINNKTGHTLADTPCIFTQYTVLMTQYFFSPSTLASEVQEPNQRVPSHQ